MKKLAQPSEPKATPSRMVTCRVHFGVHFERTTCSHPQS